MPQPSSTSPEPVVLIANRGDIDQGGLLPTMAVDPLSDALADLLV